MSTHTYYRLKAAHALFDKHCNALDETESRRVDKVAQRFGEIESAVLASDEARDVCVPDGAVDAALAEIRGRYEHAEGFEEALDTLGLDIAGFTAALRRDLFVDTVMERVAARTKPVGETEAEIFYYTHAERFRKPEQRTARHVLVTINDDLSDNTRDAARRRIGEIARRLQAKPQRFEEQALKHSECPTALNGGLLGEVQRGQLYPDLDQALFAMAEGAVSDVLESELGFHVLYCEKISPARTLAFTEVVDSLRQRLTEDRARRDSRAWLESLLRRKQDDNREARAALVFE